MTKIRKPVNLLPHQVMARVQELVETQDYNIGLSNIPEAWKISKGEGVKVVVLDTGTPDHPDITLAGSKSFITGYNIDGCGHGTHVAGIIRATQGNGIGIVGIAPKCDLYTGAVLDMDGSGDIQPIVDGIMWAVDVVKADIINMSLGLDASAPDVRAMHKACDYAKAKGVTVICAAGNEFGKVGQPAKYNTVVAVAAVDDAKKHASFSNCGPEVDFATGGVNVFSTYLNKGYAKLSGTSMASPVLSGIAALILGASLSKGVKLTPDQLYDQIRKIAFDLGAGGFDSTYGWGIPVFQSATTGIEIPDTPEPPKSWWDRFMDWLF